MIDGRERIVSAVELAAASLRGCVIESVQRLNDSPAFNEALAGHRPADRASQKRLTLLRRKLKDIATLEIKSRMA